MKKFLLGLLGLLFLLICYLAFYPVPIDPDVWQDHPVAPVLEGDYAQNDALNVVEILFKGKCLACEDVAVDSLGRIYGGTVEGKIMRFADHNSEGEVFANTGGRPLGLHFDKDQNLIVADAMKGLLSINAQARSCI